MKTLEERVSDLEVAIGGLQVQVDGISIDLSKKASKDGTDLVREIVEGIRSKGGKL